MPLSRILLVAITLLSAASTCIAQTPANEEPAPPREPGENAPPSLITDRVSREQRAHGENPSLILPYRPNYIMPVTYIDDPGEVPAAGDGGELDNVETKFQISFRLPLWDDVFSDNGDVLFAYTQLSLWQIFNDELSSPFRETNYEPELIASFDTDWDILGLKNRLLMVGLVHQSNGRSEPLSRSWNRVYANFIMEKDSFALSVKPWYRFPESEDDDDNPDIEDFLGHGEVRGVYKYAANVFSAKLRNNLDFGQNRGALELSWSFPLRKGLIGYTELFTGYGETLIDYNRDITRVGIGVAMNTWF
ncbi:MAG: phospholipase A [Gammaproteobacteria bacterium]|nr:phospholipase A [Gammaproteobacteria bacterium]